MLDGGLIGAYLIHMTTTTNEAHTVTVSGILPGTNVLKATCTCGLDSVAKTETAARSMLTRYHRNPA